MTFDELRERIQRMFDFPISLSEPYKLCDYKPAYGDIFEKEIEGYEWFGWCDIDLIWGDLYSFIGKYLSDEKNEKILEHGHCTLLRNNARMRTMYKERVEGIMSYDEVFRTNQSMYFDEHGPLFSNNAFAGLCEKKGVRIQSKMVPILDCSLNTEWFVPFVKKSIEKKYRNTLITYEDGKVYWAYRLQGSTDVHIEEQMYAHIQKRRMQVATRPVGHFHIVPPANLVAYSPQWRMHIRELAPNDICIRWRNALSSMRIVLRRKLMQILRIKNIIIKNICHNDENHGYSHIL